jgi:iron complex outermembrane receptor protein
MKHSRGSFKSTLLSCSLLAFATGLSIDAVAQEAAAAKSGQGPPVSDSDQPIEQVVVTGSRVITNGNSSATPLTVVSTEDLAQTTPSDIPDGLNKLPIFAGSTSQRTTSGATSNGEGDFLNLRDFGAQRTLILLNGNRVPATAQDGTVNVDTLPQLLIKRVDVITGGASSVYGSDAVTGVVNFVLDTTFNGLKTEAQTGISGQGDDMSWKAGFAAGTNLFGGRGHIEFSYEHYTSDGISDMKSRPLGADVYTEAGLGTAASPYYLAPNSRYVQETPGGYIENGPLKGNFFPSTGVMAPYSFGTPLIGNSGASSGGDGGFSGEAPSDCSGCNQSLIGALHDDQGFVRFDYDLADHLHAYAQLSAADSYNFNSFFSQWFNQSVPSTNVYLPPAAAATLAAAGTPSFGFERQFEDYPQWSSEAQTQSYNATVGFSGAAWGDYHWNAHYTYGESILQDSNPYNTNNQRLTAALDSVLVPAGMPNAGTAVCAVSLTAYASQYAGCQPLNPFGPNAPTGAAVQWIDGDTTFHQYDKLNDLAADLAGTLFNGWAGPFKGAFSAEYRYSTLESDSNFNSTAKINCAGLNPVSCNPNEALWGQSVVSSLPKVGEGVWEGAVEADAPLVKDLPLVQLFDLDLAARYTRYSISGPATTWKIGPVWTVYNDLTFRATASRDIRAPTLYDLYAPQASNNQGYQDLLTGVTANTRTVTQGNPDLKSEISRTTTAGFVYTPSFVPNFSLALDTFHIVINNAITQVNGTNPSVEELCNSSNGTSPYCSLYIRPISPTSTAPGNYPTYVLVESLNVAKTSTHGFDAEANYHFGLEQVNSNLEGTINTRLFLTYQPSFLTNTGIPGAVITDAAGAVPLAATRVTFDYGYVDGPFSVNAETRYHTSERQNSNPTLVFDTPAVPAISYTDLTLAYHFRLRPRDSASAGQVFLSIQNLMNQQPHIWMPLGYTSAPGFAFPAPYDEDVIGRYFTVGVKYQL